jgi:phosphate:Na+ symporter
MQQGDCTMDAGFIWSDLLTDLERTADHCSNIAGCIMDAAHHDMNIHESLREFRSGSAEFRGLYREYAQKYLCPEQRKRA